MDTPVKVSQFENLEKRYSFKMIENDESYTIFAQEKGVLIISMFYSKLDNKIISLEGKLAEGFKNNNFTQVEKLERVNDYVRFAVDFYHPSAGLNENNFVVLNRGLKP